jgi:Domain of unknown function (DUF6265)
MKTQLLSGSIILSSIFLLSACSTTEETEVNSLKWMLGKWQSSTEEGILYEEWKKVNDSTYSGHAYAITPEGDTTFSETAEITKINGAITYSVTVNEESTTDFALVDNQDIAVFENVDHDFPQRIIYQKLAKDSLFARIEGTVDGEDQFEEYRYVKSK